MKDLLEKVDSYLVGKLSGTALDDWATGNLKRVLATGVPAYIDALDTVLVGFVGVSEQVIELQEFHERLETMMRAMTTYTFDEVSSISHDEPPSLHPGLITGISDFIQSQEDLQLVVSLAG